MLTLVELSAYLDELLPSNGVVDYCPNGLQVEGKPLIGKIATAVSASVATIEEAAKTGVDALIVHHGIFWKGEKETIQGVKRKKLQLLLEHGISLFAYHLPLDMHRTVGNNWKAALDLGWLDLEPFATIGVKGKIPSSSREKIQQQLEKYYSHSATCVWGGKKEIQTIALVSGGAYKTIADASKEKIDAFITGSFDEPVWHQALEEQVNFYALGHSATERVGPIALGKQLESALHQPCSFIDVVNPF